MSSKTEKDPNTTTIRARRTTSQALGSLVRQYQDNPAAIPASVKAAIGEGPVNGPVVLEAAVARLAEESKSKPSPKSKMSSGRRGAVRSIVVNNQIYGIKLIQGASVDDVLDELHAKVNFMEPLDAEEAKICGGAQVFCMSRAIGDVIDHSAVSAIIDLPFLREEKTGKFEYEDCQLPELLEALPRIQELVTKRFATEQFSFLDGEKAGFQIPRGNTRSAAAVRAENEGKTKLVLMEIACERDVICSMIRMLHSVGIAVPLYIPSAIGEVSSPSSFEKPIRVVCSVLAGDLIKNLLASHFNTKPGRPSAMTRLAFRGRTFASFWEIESLLQEHREYSVDIFGRNELNSMDHCESFCYAVDLITGDASAKEIRWILAYSEGKGGVPPEVTVTHSVPGAKGYHPRGVKPVIDGTRAWSLVDERFAGPATDAGSRSTFRLGALCDAQGNIIASQDPYDVLMAALADRPFGMRLETIRALASEAPTLKRKELDAAISAAGESKQPDPTSDSAAVIAQINLISSVICAEAGAAITRGIAANADGIRDAVRTRLGDRCGERFEDRYELALRSLTWNKVIHPITETYRSIRFL